LIILLAVVVLAVILGLLGPRTAHIERETVIAAPSSVVWDHVSSLRQQDEWSPFRDIDPGLQVTFEGTDGEVGSKSMWEGKESGKGMQEITAVDPGKHVQVGLHFTAPFEGEATGNILLEPLDDSTKVTWTYDGENNFIVRIICVFKDMDAMMGPVFANGLAKLKTACEADAVKRSAELKARTFRGYVVDTVDLPARTYLGKRSMVKWDKIGAYLATVFPSAFQAMSNAGLTKGGPPSGLYYKWDEAGRQTDMFAGIPVASGADTVKVDGFTTVTIPSGKALMIAYHGAYDKSEDAHEAMNDMMKANNMELRDAVIEEYVTDPMQEADTAKWLTNIYYPVK
jgi:effector-binding domain-containing protein